MKIIDPRRKIVYFSRLMRMILVLVFSFFSLNLYAHSLSNWLEERDDIWLKFVNLDSSKKIHQVLALKDIGSKIYGLNEITIKMRLNSEQDCVELNSHFQGGTDFFSYCDPFHWEVSVSIFLHQASQIDEFFELLDTFEAISTPVSDRIKTHWRELMNEDRSQNEGSLQYMNSNYYF